MEKGRWTRGQGVKGGRGPPLCTSPGSTPGGYRPYNRVLFCSENDPIHRAKITCLVQRRWNLGRETAKSVFHVITSDLFNCLVNCITFAARANSICDWGKLRAVEIDLDTSRDETEQLDIGVYCAQGGVSSTVAWQFVVINLQWAKNVNSSFSSSESIARVYCTNQRNCFRQLFVRRAAEIYYNYVHW